MFATPSGVLSPGILSLVFDIAAAGVVVLARIGDRTTCLGFPPRVIAKVVLGRVEVEFVAVRLLEVRVPVDVVETLDETGGERCWSGPLLMLAHRSGPHWDKPSAVMFNDIWMLLASSQNLHYSCQHGFNLMPNGSCCAKLVGSNPSRTCRRVRADGAALRGWGHCYA